MQCIFGERKRPNCQYETMRLPYVRAGNKTFAAKCIEYNLCYYTCEEGNELNLR